MRRFKEVLSDKFAKEVLGQEKVLLYIYLKGCSPCERLSETLGPIEGPEIMQMDAMANLEVITEYNLEEMPGLMLFEAGKLRKKLEGAVLGNMSLDELKNSLGLD